MEAFLLYIDNLAVGTDKSTDIFYSLFQNYDVGKKLLTTTMLKYNPIRNWLDGELEITEEETSSPSIPWPILGEIVDSTKKEKDEANQGNIWYRDVATGESFSGKIPFPLTKTSIEVTFIHPDSGRKVLITPLNLSQNV